MLLGCLSAGALILAALAALLLWRRRRARTRRQSALKPLGPAEVLGSVGTDVETLTDQDTYGAPKGAR
jgi:membrane protein implicated in regulation of membrane protease activity